MCVEESRNNPLPPTIQDALKLVTIPFFHVIGRRIRFYLLAQLNGDVYGVWEWGTERLPTKDTDVADVVLLCKKFLIHRVSFFVLFLFCLCSILSYSSDFLIEITESSQPSRPFQWASSYESQAFWFWWLDTSCSKWHCEIKKNIYSEKEVIICICCPSLPNTFWFVCFVSVKKHERDRTSRLLQLRGPIKDSIYYYWMFKKCTVTRKIK